jgi:hypothetical protein
MLSLILAHGPLQFNDYWSCFQTGGNFSDKYVSFLAANKVSCRQNSSNRKAGIEEEEEEAL